MENNGKPRKIRIRLACEELDCESESRLRVGKVLAPHGVRPKTVPLTEYNEMSLIFEIYIFHEK